MRAGRLAGAVVALVMIGAGAVAQSPPAAPGGFRDPPPPIPADWLRALPQPQRQPVQALHDLCTRWNAAATPEARTAAAEEARRAVAAMTEQRGWFGVVTERDISGDWGALTVAIAPGVLLETAGVGFLSMDTNDTRIARGSQDFSVLASVRRGEPVAYNVRLLRPRFGSGRCVFLARLTRLRN